MKTSVKYKLEHHVPSFIYLIVGLLVILIILSIFFFRLPLITSISLIPIIFLILIAPSLSANWIIVHDHKVELWSHPVGKEKVREWSLNFDQIDSIEINQSLINIRDIYEHSYNFNAGSKCYDDLKARINTTD